MKIRIYPYRTGSQAAKLLRDTFQSFGFDAKLLRRDGRSTFTPETGDLVINWGSTDDLPYPEEIVLLNKPENIRAATSKLTTFQRLEEAEVPTVRFTTIPAEARRWNTSGMGVYARTVDRGRSGRGITYLPACFDGDFPEAPLYTQQGVGREYRVHVIGGKVVRVQKRWKEEDDCPIRSHDNGYTFIVDGFKRPRGLKKAATNAVSALGLDFGAVDLVNAMQGNGNRRPLVLEVNTAAGLEGTTVEDYAKMLIEEYIPEEQRHPTVPEPEESLDTRDEEDPAPSPATTFNLNITLDLDDEEDGWDEDEDEDEWDPANCDHQDCLANCSVCCDCRAVLS